MTEDEKYWLGFLVYRITKPFKFLELVKNKELLFTAKTQPRKFILSLLT